MLIGRCFTKERRLVTGYINPYYLDVTPNIENNDGQTG